MLQSLEPDIIIATFWLDAYTNIFNDDYDFDNYKERDDISNSIYEDINSTILNIRNSFTGPIFISNFPRNFEAKLGFIDTITNHGSYNSIETVNNNIKSICD